MLASSVRTSFTLTLGMQSQQRCWQPLGKSMSSRCQPSAGLWRLSRRTVKTWPRRASSWTTPCWCVLLSMLQFSSIASNDSMHQPHAVDSMRWRHAVVLVASCMFGRPARTVQPQPPRLCTHELQSSLSTYRAYVIKRFSYFCSICAGCSTIRGPASMSMRAHLKGA